MGLSGRFKMLLCVLLLVGCTHQQSQPEIVEDNLVAYPGRTFSYKVKFNDLQSRQHDVACRIGLPRPPKDRDDAAKRLEADGRSQRRGARGGV